MNQSIYLRPRTAARAWYREHFIDHPRYVERVEGSLYSYPGGKPKVVCKYCLPIYVAKCRVLDQHEVESNGRAYVRTEDEIVRDSEWFFLIFHLFIVPDLKWSVWNEERNAESWLYLEGRSSTLLRHLSKCKWQQDRVVAQRAAEELDAVSLHRHATRAAQSLALTSATMMHSVSHAPCILLPIPMLQPSQR